MAKKLASAYFSLLITFSLALNTSAQTQKGNLMLGGSMGFTSSKNESSLFSDQKDFSFNFSPNISYAVIDQLFVGLIIPVFHSRSSSNGQDYKNNQYSFGSRIRYYLPFGDFAAFAQTSYSIGKSKFKGPNFNPLTGQLDDLIINGTLKTPSIGLGLAYFINNNIGLQGQLSYNKQSIEYDSELRSDYDMSYMNFKIGFQIHLQTIGLD